MLHLRQETKKKKKESRPHDELNGGMYSFGVLFVATDNAARNSWFNRQMLIEIGQEVSYELVLLLCNECQNVVRIRAGG